MVRFLIHRPIAVTMTYIALLLLGLVASRRLPVSLMPDIDIPRITVQVSDENAPAREIEKTIVSPLRRLLMQTAHLNDITSETRDGSALIFLDFDYGTDVDYAFIEVNEKIDKAMNNLPRTLQRPRVIKASVSDIPVFYLDLSVRDTTATGHKEIQGRSGVSPRFAELSDFAFQVIAKRIEQLPEVAMVDISGRVYPELLIIPDMKKMQSLGLKLEDIEQAIRKNNVNLGNLLIRNGQYQYNIRFESTLHNKQDIESIYLRVEDKLLQLKDITVVKESTRERRGMVTSNGLPAVTMAVIKQSDARMREMKESLHTLVEHLREDYPGIRFTVTRDQTLLLDYSIANLGQSLLLGALMAFLVMFLFLNDIKSPLLIGITIPTSLVITLLFFMLTGISINIISLSGLILGVGMMVDNSIIVIDNITQYRDRGFSLDDACVLGTNEVFRPLLSSVLTTSAVFIPLIFISGLAGALFYDQAIAVTLGLFVSLAVSITLLPVYYRLFYFRSPAKPVPGIFMKKLNRLDYGALYERGFRFVMRRQLWVVALVGFCLAAAAFLYDEMPRSKFPPLTSDELMVYIDWNERIHIDENNRRVAGLLSSLEDNFLQSTALVGEQQFLLDYHSRASSSEALIYLKLNSPDYLIPVTDMIKKIITRKNPRAVVKIRKAGNVFDLIFTDNEAPLTARLRAVTDYGADHARFLNRVFEKIRRKFPDQHFEAIPWNEHLVLKTDPVKLMMYDIPFERVTRALTSALNSNRILVITRSNYFIPVVLGDNSRMIDDILTSTMVTNENGKQINLSNLVSTTKEYDLKTIIAGKEGEFFPLGFQVGRRETGRVMDTVRQVLREEGHFEADFSGSIFSGRRMISQLAMIMLISLLLLYFILAAQFESLVLPFIVLIEVPVDLIGVFVFLVLFKEGINIMSLIGIVVMSGIIINDSILKIDTINRLRASGYSLLHAIAEGGKRRLKPIVMTSMTTILTLIPFLWKHGLGADLQKPLALAVIGGMTVGTMVSLYLVPLIYYYFGKLSGKLTVRKNRMAGK